ncbi:hypothetical protein [Roseibacillus persicicus]|uniref:Uncharacterized protein n=1 Tax=Roseibacillus persicicus TaxID=454148 RepID=A0A918TMD6_9BACT|nr:hypothetical protein [Roseibacillus persicicus]MDQ8191369.1 hypothetical protein [Roseibacillus persicicus]GHC54674.1 hypothetical protein GCM10007100_21430 [Roseibacillus persicicus]
MPGISSIGLVFLGAAFGSTGFLTEQQLVLALLFLLLLISICAGVFASILKITDRDGREGIHGKALAFETTVFCLIQCLVTPLVFVTIAFGGCLLFISL